MKPQIKIALTILTILILVIVFYFVSEKISSLTGKGISGATIQTDIDNFVKCLSKKNIKLYVKEGCLYCASQKRYFGSSLQHFNVIECTEQNLCEKLEEVPAWEINNKIYYGIKSLKEISELSGCSF